MLYYHLQVLLDGPGQFSTNSPIQNIVFPAGTFHVPVSVAIPLNSGKINSRSVSQDHSKLSTFEEQDSSILDQIYLPASSSWNVEQGECLAIVSVIECKLHKNEIQGSTQNNEGICHVVNTSTVQKLSREMIIALIESEGGLAEFDTSWSIRLGTWGIGKKQGARIQSKEDIERSCGFILYDIPCLVEHSVGRVTHGRDMGWCFLEPGMFLAVRYAKYVDAIVLGSSRYGGKGGSLTEIWRQRWIVNRAPHGIQ